jgi:hypothetical protein
MSRSLSPRLFRISPMAEVDETEIRAHRAARREAKRKIQENCYSPDDIKLLAEFTFWSVQLKILKCLKAIGKTNCAFRNEVAA